MGTMELIGIVVSCLVIFCRALILESKIKKKNDRISRLENEVDLLNTQSNGYMDLWQDKCHEYISVCNELEKAKKRADLLTPLNGVEDYRMRVLNITSMLNEVLGAEVKTVHISNLGVCGYNVEIKL